MEVYKEFIINHNLQIPTVKPPMERFLSQKIEYNITKLTLIDTQLVTDDNPPLPIRKVVVGGTVIITVKYVAAVPEQNVHGAHFEEKFALLVEWPGGPNPGTPLCAEVITEYMNFRMSGERTISKTIVAQIEIKTQ